MNHLKKVDLNAILIYQNQVVVDAFCANFQVTIDDAKLVFEDMLRFFWLCCDENINLRKIDNSLLIIDEMWHTFILHTRDYSKFCEDYFGFYIHHQPTSAEEKKQQRVINSSSEGRERMLKSQRERYTRICDLLGREVFIRWFLIYPEKFSKENILKLKVTL